MPMSHILLSLRFGRRRIDVTVAHALAIALFAGLTSLAVVTERMFGSLSTARVGIVLALFLALVAALFMVTRRVGLAAFVAAALLVGLGALSKSKFAYLGATLHSLDLYVYLGAPTELAFFAWHQPQVTALGLVLVMLMAPVSVQLWRYEAASTVPRLAALPLVLLPLLPASHFAASPNLQAQMEHGHFYDGYHLTSWFLSLFRPIDNTALQARFPGKSADAAAPQRAATVTPAPVAALPQRPPNIVLILHESTIDPRPFRPEERARFDVEPFASMDGITRRLIVETYGGNTWISEYGVMFGLSTHYFRPNQAFLGHLLEGKMRHSLAHALAGHGYGSTYVYPAPKSFANTGRFYKALGFERVLDYFDQQKPAYNRRDRDHYETALADLARRRADGDLRPQFTFVMTEAPHFPWDTTYFPAVRADEIRPGDPYAEYARRLRIGHDDYAAFKARLAAQFPGERFVLVGFGDHHPRWTASYIESTDPAASPRYDTFYRLDGIGIDATRAAPSSPIEIGYLGTVMMEAAGLPLDASYQLRREALHACAGLLFRCSDQARVMELHRALVERGDFVPVYALSRGR